jgi:8-oxo-dGTP pyrophosphatase MutT (NUDIX family)
VLNQPAGHLDPDETLIDAAIRETLEETGWDVEPTGVIGIYLYTAPSNGVTYQRICFSAKAVQHHPDYQLDDGIVGAKWLTRDELIAHHSLTLSRSGFHRRLLYQSLWQTSLTFLVRSIAELCYIKLLITMKPVATGTAQPKLLCRSLRQTEL